MRSRFDRALDFYLENEGGDVDHSADPGGLTSRGLASVYNPEVGDVTALSDEEVRAIYREKYWYPIFDQIRSDWIAIKVFDISTNAGFDDASLVVQRAVNRCGGRLVVDSVMGSKTVNAMNAIEEHDLGGEICAQQWGMYRRKMKVDENKQAFYNGWMRRADRMPGA